MTTGKTIALTRETFRFLQFPFFEVYYGEEIPFIQGKEQQLHVAGSAVKRYTTPKVRETQVRWQMLQEPSEGRHTETIITEN